MNGFAVTLSSVATSILLKYLRERERDFLFSMMSTNISGDLELRDCLLLSSYSLKVDRKSKIETNSGLVNV